MAYGNHALCSRRSRPLRRIQERSRSKSPGPAFTLRAAVNALVLPSECRSRGTDVVAAARAVPPASRHQGNGCTARSRCGGTVHGRAWCRQISWRYGRRATVCWRNPAHALPACVRRRRSSASRRCMPCINAGVGRYAGSFDAERDMAMTTRCGGWATVMAVAMAVTMPAGAATLPAGAAK